jgi:hypothetical protein
LILAGCSTVTKPGFPRQSYDEQKQIQQLEAQFDPNKMLAAYDFGAETVPARNRIISAKLVLIDLNYSSFITNSSFQKQTLDTVTDVVLLGLSIGATAVGGAPTKTLLSAIATGVAGSKLAVDKNFYYEKTISALVAAMNAQRKTALIPIQEGLTQGTDRYPLTRALSDLDNYYLAGTFVGALQAIQADAGAKEAKADEALNNIRTTSFLDDKHGQALQKYWMPLWTPGPSDPAKLVVDPARQKSLRDWMDANGLKDIPIQQFITGGVFAELRKKAVADLRISID